MSTLAVAQVATFDPSQTLDETGETIIMSFMIHARILLLSDALGLIIGRGLSCLGGRTQ